MHPANLYPRRSRVAPRLECVRPVEFVELVELDPSRANIPF